MEATGRKCPFQDHHPTDLLTLDLGNADAAVEAARAFAAQHPLSAVVGVDDDTTVVAALISEELELPSNPVSAVRAARSKPLQRRMLHERGVPVPTFTVRSFGEDPIEVALSTEYPCVLKPVSLSASRGVIRANNRNEFLLAHARLDAIVKSARRAERHFLVERYISGPEFALEGLVVSGELHVLALFDKPDPLEGPFFEETIYVTPSRLDVAAQERLTDCARQAVAALGLVRGPVHIELRYNEEGPWLIELAARPIGGKCGRILRFGDKGELSLETLILRQAIDTLTNVPLRASVAAGVMMIPIPHAGVLLGVDGVEEAGSEPGVEEVLITAPRGQELVPLPEGSRYLGFIFARGETPAFVEAALRGAQKRLAIRIARLEV